MSGRVFVAGTQTPDGRPRYPVDQDTRVRCFAAARVVGTRRARDLLRMCGARSGENLTHLPPAIQECVVATLERMAEALPDALPSGKARS